MKNNIDKSLKELKEIYPKFSQIVNNWIMFCHIHGEQISESETKIIKEHARILTDLGVLPLENN